MVMNDIFYIETIISNVFRFRSAVFRMKTTNFFGCVKNLFFSERTATHLSKYVVLGHSDVTSTRNIPQQIDCCLPLLKMSSLTL